MPAKAAKPSPTVIEIHALRPLFDELHRQGYTIIAPSVKDGAIVLQETGSVEDLPFGWTDEQSPAKYRLRQRLDDTLFGFNCGPQSWKRFLLVPQTVVWRGQREGMQPDKDKNLVPRLAFFGVRSCDLSAIRIQDRVLMEGPFADADYTRRRKNTLIIAVNCTEAGSTCFCTSMGSGPKATSHFDLSITEITEGGHRFVVETGSKRGEEILTAVPHRPAEAKDMQLAEQAVDRAAGHMGRTLDTNGLREALYDGVEHPRWDNAAARCLSCANCTLVCPTCFCSTMEDTTDLTGTTAERKRRWDSCFTLDFSYIHGGSVRSSVRARYRHWLTHKLGTWIDQFGTPGCVGCGRCITWCPAAIDITEEAAAIRQHSVTNEVLDGND